MPSACRRNANGSFSPVGFSPTPNRPDQSFELVCECNTQRGGAMWQRIACKSRVIVFANGRRYRCWLAIVLRVILAHHALQLRKLADHQRAQIGLGERRRAFDRGGIYSQLFSQHPTAIATIRSARCNCEPSLP